MKKSEIRDKFTSLLKEKFDNVEDKMYFPDEHAQLSNAFPYVTIVFGSWTPQGNALYGTQTLSIIGITQGDNDTLTERIDEMENDIFSAIHKKEIQLNITEVNNTNLFAPFGLEAGLFPPFGGVRFEITVSNVKVAI